MKTNKWFIITVVLVMLVGLGVILHHLLISGKIFDVSDLAHHETFWVACFSFAAGLLLAKRIR